MGSIFKIVLCAVCVNIIAANAYKAGALLAANNIRGVLSSISEAGKQNLDILVLPSDIGELNSYDDTIKTLSKAAKQSNLYLVAHLKDNIRCESKRIIMRSNVVFDRNGEIVAEYRKPENNIANCTKLCTEPATFSTNFGTFTVMMEEDLVMRSEDLKVKNVIVTGDWTSDVQFFSAPNFASSWSYTNNVNLLTSYGIYAGKSGLMTDGLKTDGLMVAILDGKIKESVPVLQTFPLEDLSKYIVKPLDIEAATMGYSEIVCHNAFCCNFHIKIREKGSKSDSSYGLAVFDGQRHYGRNQYIGLQSCGVFACAGLYKRSCNFGTENNTNIIFETLTISANFTKQTVQYPIIVANRISTDSFNFCAKTGKNTEVTISLKENNVLSFGIFGRNFEKDHEVFQLQNTDGVFYNYIFNEDVQEFFDYVWIRLRILLFVVSIYVLEMM